MYKYLIIIIIIIFLSSISVQAQTQDSIGSIQTEKIDVIKRYEASILQAQRKKIKPNIKTKSFSPISYNYQLESSKDVEFERPDPIIKVLGYKGKATERQEIKNGYLYGSFGNYSNITVGSGYHYYIENWLEAGYKIDHNQASNYDSINYKYSKSNANLYAAYYLGERNKVKLDLNGSRNLHNLFQLDSLNNQVGATSYGANLSLMHNSFEQSGLSIQTDIGYTKYNNKIDTFGENLFSASTNIYKTINNELSIELPITYNSYSPDSLESVNNVSDLILSPNARYKKDNIYIKAGVQYVNADTNSILFPIFEVTMRDVYAGISLSIFTDIDYQRNSLSTLSKQNPYLETSSYTYSPSYKRGYNIRAGKAIGNIMTGLKISYNRWTNDRNYFDDGRFFNYDEIDRKEIVIAPQVKYSPSDNISFNLEPQYYVYLNEDDNAPLFYRPNLKIDLKGEQKIMDNKLSFNQSLSYYSDRNFGSTSSEGETSYFDLGLGTRYQVSKSIVVYANGTNLISSDNFVWNIYEVFEKQLWGGVKVLF